MASHLGQTRVPFTKHHIRASMGAPWSGHKALQCPVIPINVKHCNLRLGIVEKGQDASLSLGIRCIPSNSLVKPTRRPTQR